MTLKVNVPNGQGLDARDMENPLRSFSYPKKVLDGEYGDFSPEGGNSTYRCPSPQSYPESANQLLGQRSYRQWIVSSSPNMLLN